MRAVAIPAYLRQRAAYALLEVAHRQTERIYIPNELLVDHVRGRLKSFAAEPIGLHGEAMLSDPSLTRLVVEEPVIVMSERMASGMEASLGACHRHTAPCSTRIRLNLKQ